MPFSIRSEHRRIVKRYRPDRTFIVGRTIAVGQNNLPELTLVFL